MSLCFCWNLNAQIQDSTLSAKEQRKIERKIKNENWLPSPKKALLLGLTIPGGGQIHNRRWWKLPFVYGIYGGIIYAIDYNGGWFRRFRDAFLAEANSETHEFSGLGLSSNSLRSFRNKFDKQLQLSYLGLFLAHGLISMEGFVDAHLQSFDIDDDLSLRIQPQVIMDPLTAQPFLAIGMRVDF